jgi:hypothetical protein
MNNGHTKPTVIGTAENCQGAAMSRFVLFVALLVLLSAFTIVADEKKAALPNPRLVSAKDSKLGTDFEYLIYDLGNGAELKLIKVPARGKGHGATSRRPVAVRLAASCRPIAVGFTVSDFAWRWCAETNRSEPN